MQLKGSCHCRAVRFTLESDSPVPFMHCHCSICRKTAGSGGYAINLGGDAATLKVTGSKYVTRFHALLARPASARGARRRGAISARSAAARCGCGTSAGPS